MSAPEKSAAFFEGYGSFKAGEPLSNAPAADTAEDWRHGWIAARDNSHEAGGRKRGRRPAISKSEEHR